MQEPIKDPPRRKRFQFHLSTAIVMMFVAGGLMWMNTSNRGLYEIVGGSAYGPTEIDSYAVSTGWPFIAVLRSGKAFEAEHTSEGYSIDRTPAGESPIMIDYWIASLDTIFGLALLLILCLVCESIIFRREGKKVD